MRTFLDLGLALSLLLVAGCAHHHHGHHGRPACGMQSKSDPMDMSAGSAVQAWPTVRVDEPAGARVTMERGVFGDALDVKAPFQATFEPTGRGMMGSSAGYPLEIELDATTAARYGAAAPITLTGTLAVPRGRSHGGILRIAPSDCALRALVAGDLDVLRVEAEALPTALEVCAGEGKPSCAAGDRHAMGHPPACPMLRGACPHASGGCPHGGGPCAHAGGGCPHGGGRAHHGGVAKCGAHGCRDTAVLTLRVSKR